MGYMLHIAFQNQGIEPGVLLGLRTRNDRIPAGECAFLLASTRKAIEEGSTPLKKSNLLKGGNTGCRNE